MSGSGKSTLVNDILYTALAKQIYNARTVPGRHRKISGVEHVDKVIHVDQSPIGRTPRSNPATYTGVFDHVRKLFASTPEAKMRGYLQGRFSFNVKGGRCEACSGDGTIKIEMNFLPDVYVPCEVCHGARYNRETLEVHYKGKTIAEVLDMPIEEAVDFFAAIPAISRHLQHAGRGRARLRPARPAGDHALRRRGAAGQAGHASCRSGRPAARSTCSTSRPPACTSRTSASCSACSAGLVDKGNTVLVIEHNLDVIKTADWIDRHGPRGRQRAAAPLVAAGTPEEVAGDPDQLHRRVPGAAAGGSQPHHEGVPEAGGVSTGSTAGDRSQGAGEEDRRRSRAGRTTKGQASARASAAARGSAGGRVVSEFTANSQQAPSRFLTAAR